MFGRKGRVITGGQGTRLHQGNFTQNKKHSEQDCSLKLHTTVNRMENMARLTATLMRLNFSIPVLENF